MLGFQPDSIGCVRLEDAKVLDCGCDALALHEMPRGVAMGVALRMVERPLVRLDVIEVGKAPEVSAKMLFAERALKT